VFTVKFGRVAFEQLAQCRNVLIRKPAATAKVGSQKSVFLLYPANTDAKGQPATTEMVDGGGLFRDQ
jgi:hypothetical protein